MIINTRKKLLFKDNKVYELKDTEMKLLLLLSDNETHSIEEILKYLNKSYESFHYWKTRLWDRYSIGLHMRYGFGYKITKEIFIDK